jgi:transcriptional regulator with XRE-family HTH domain
MSQDTAVQRQQRKIAKKIRSRRRDLLLDIKSMAAKLHLSADEYQRFEDGQCQINPRLLNAICMELRVPINDIASNDDNYHKVSQPT